MFWGKRIKDISKIYFCIMDLKKIHIFVIEFIENK